MDSDELLSTTRSVRRRLDLTRPVDLELVQDCLRLAVQAPTGGVRQHWRWMVVTDSTLRKGIAELYREAFQARYPIERADARWPAKEVSSARHLAEHLDQVPVLVIPCLELADGELPAGNQAGLWGSLLPAAWSYMLAARARGLGTCWTAVHLDREREVAELLGLPERVRQGALIPTAHVSGTFRPAARVPLESVVYVDGWDAR
jgi:nitroreductase